MSFGELIAIVRDVVEQKSHGGGVSMPYYPYGEWRGELQIGELIIICEVSNPGAHGYQMSLMWVLTVNGDVW